MSNFHVCISQCSRRLGERWCACRLCACLPEFSLYFASCFDSIMVSREEVKLLLDVQRDAYNDMVSNLMATFNERLSKTEKEVCDLRAENSSLRQAHHQQTLHVDELINKLEEIEGVCEGVRFDAQPINVRLDDLEDRSRRNNLRFEGIPESYRENWEQTADHVGRLVREKLGVEGDVAVQRAHRVGDPNSGRPRTIIANFLRFRDRQEILRNRHKLKNTDIYVNEDLCSASLAKRRQQLPELQRARREGKTAFFVHTKLVIKERVTADGVAGENIVADGGEAVVADGGGSSEGEDVPSGDSANDVHSEVDGERSVDNTGTNRESAVTAIGRGSGTAGEGGRSGAAGGRGSGSAAGGRGSGGGGGRGSGAPGAGRGSGGAGGQRASSRGGRGRGPGGSNRARGSGSAGAGRGSGSAGGNAGDIAGEQHRVLRSGVDSNSN